MTTTVTTTTTTTTKVMSVFLKTTTAAAANNNNNQGNVGFRQETWECRENCRFQRKTKVTYVFLAVTNIFLRKI